MRGFGQLKDIDQLRKVMSITEAENLVEMKDLTDEQEVEMGNVAVPEMETDEYKASGSAGNTPDPALNKEKDAQLGATEVDQDEDPQMDGLGGSIGGSIRKEMTRTEAFDGNEVVDEEGMDAAKYRTSEAVIDKVEDIFTEMFGKSYQEKAKEKDYDLDTTNPTVITGEPPKYKNIKKGW